MIVAGFGPIEGGGGFAQPVDGARVNDGKILLDDGQVGSQAGVDVSSGYIFAADVTAAGVVLPAAAAAVGVVVSPEVAEDASTRHPAGGPTVLGGFGFEPVVETGQPAGFVHQIRDAVAALGKV